MIIKTIRTEQGSFIGMAAPTPQPLKVGYWVEPVSLLSTNYELITASVAGSGHDSAARNIVYCALRGALPTHTEQGSEGHLSDLRESLRAGTAQITPDYPANHETIKQVLEYLAGQRRDFDLRLQFFGTAFQEKVWLELLKIPYGATQCYADIARAVGNPQGARAVGMANNRNPVSLIVPCHRVIGKNGRLVGYGGGLDIKARLLALEKALSS